MSPDSVVGTATGYGLDDQVVGVRVPLGSRIFASAYRPDRLWGPPSLLSNGHREAIFPGVKRPESEADHSPPTSAKVKKTWMYASTPPYVLNYLSTGTSIYFYQTTRFHNPEHEESSPAVEI
jgi:hypothetical protein